MNKKFKISKLSNDMLDKAIFHMKANIEKALNSSAIDVDAWDEENDPMILPKIILIAVLEEEVWQYYCAGTRFDKPMRKEIKNLKLFL